MKNKKQVFISLFIVFLGILALYLFIKFRKKPEKIKVEYKGPIVEIVTCETKVQPIALEVFGTVDSLKKVNLMPQVSGKVIKVSEKFKEGGFFKKGEILLNIEDIDYKLALKRAEANLFTQELNYKKALKQAKIAKEQWEEIYNNLLKGKNIVPDELTLYIPQLKTAKSLYDAAKAEVKQAKLNLERTKIKAPFDCIIISKNVDIGQVVTPQVSLCSIYSVDNIEIITPLTKKQAELVSPGNEAKIFPGEKSGSTVIPAKIDRISGTYDIKTRMVNAYLTLNNKKDGSKLKLNDFVTCNIESNPVLCSKIPINSYRDGKVWLYQNGKLKIKDVRLICQSKEFAYVSGLPEKFKLITTNLYAVSDGMKVRLMKGKK